MHNAQHCPVIQVEAVTSAALSPTPDWRDKVLWLVGDLGYPRRLTCGRELANTLPHTDAVERLAWLQGQRFPMPWGEVLEGAAVAGWQDLVTWVLSEAREERGARVWGEQQQQQQLVGEGGLGAVRAALVAAARAGQLGVLRELCGPGVGVEDRMGCAGRDAFTAAVEGGQVEAAAWLDARGAGLVRRVGQGASDAGDGRQREPEKAQPQQPHWGEDRQEGAQGQEPVQEQRQQGQGGDQGGQVTDGREGGAHEQEQEEEQEQERERLGQLVLRAVSSGSMDVVRWLERRAAALGLGGVGRLAGAEAWQAAAAVGCGELVEWLAASGCPMPVGGSVGC